MQQLNSECLFCKIVNSKQGKIFEDNKTFMFCDINPKAEHHYLLVPKKHIQNSAKILTYEDMELVAHMI